MALMAWSMLDIQKTDAAMPATEPATIRREDYRPPAWFVPEISISTFNWISNGPSSGRGSMFGDPNRPNIRNRCLLDGDDLLPVGIKVDGESVRGLEAG